MKVVLAASLFLAVSVVDARFALERGLAEAADCSKCFDVIDDARDCLRECNNKAWPGTNTDDRLKKNCDDDDDTTDEGGARRLNNHFDCDDDDVNVDDERQGDERSLLDYCLDDSIDEVDDIDDLQDCCEFRDNKCEEYFDQVQECLVGCLNPCLIMNAANWLDCLQDSANDGSCSRQECLDGFLEDLPDDLGLDGNNQDLFDLASLEKRVQKIENEDLEDCSLLKDFVEDTCKIGSDCCSRCQDDLGASVDCLLNDIIIPFSSAALNLTIDECPIDTERCAAGWRRSLTQETADKFNKAMNLPSKSENKPKRAKRTLQDAPTDAIDPNAEAVASCQRKMEQQIVTYNMTYATNNFLQCVMKLGVATFDEPEADTTGTTADSSTSGAASMFKIFGLLSTLLLASVF